MVSPVPILHRYRGTALAPNRVGGWLNSLENDRSGPHHCSRGRRRAGPPFSCEATEGFQVGSHLTRSQGRGTPWDAGSRACRLERAATRPNFRVPHFLTMRARIAPQSRRSRKLRSLPPVGRGSRTVSSHAALPLRQTQSRLIGLPRLWQRIADSDHLDAVTRIHTQIDLVDSGI